MRIEAFEQFRGVALDAGVLLYFTGEFSPAITAALADSLRRRLEAHVADRPTRRRLFSTFVEMTQNILHYAAPAPGAAEDEGGEARRKGAVALGQTGPEYWVVCANLVEAALVPRLTARLETVRRLDAEALHQAYRRQLANDRHEAEDPLSRGAGLGLLTIARACTAPLEYRLAPEPHGDPRLAAFHLCARLSTDPATDRSLA